MQVSPVIVVDDCRVDLWLQVFLILILVVIALLVVVFVVVVLLSRCFVRLGSLNIGRLLLRLVDQLLTSG